MAAKLQLSLDGVSAELEVQRGPEGVRVRINDRWHAVDFEPTGRHGLYSLLIDGVSWEVYAERRTGGWSVLIGNRVYEVERLSERARVAAAEPAGVWVLRSPLAGIVVAAQVAAGDTVQAGQVVLIVESMKMNNELTAARAGTVTDVYVHPGDRVERGASLLRIE